MKNVLFNSVLVAFVLLVASCGKQPEAKVEVMSFNIRLDHVADSMNNWKYRKDNAAQMIAYYAPDIVGMQEVVKNQLNDLKERLPQYTALGVGRADGKEKGEYCSLFYKTERFELLKNGDFGLSETPDSIGKKGWDAACERIVTWAVLKDKVSGRKVAAFNTHFDHVGEVARRESAKLILEKIKQIAGELPVIITGDFNGTVDSELSMTPQERRNPKLLNPSRKHRIAKGAGVDISVVNRFIKQFEQSQKMMKQLPGMMGGMGGIGKKGKFRLPF